MASPPPPPAWEAASLPSLGVELQHLQHARLHLAMPRQHFLQHLVLLKTLRYHHLPHLTHRRRVDLWYRLSLASNHFAWPSSCSTRRLSRWTGMYRNTSITKGHTASFVSQHDVSTVVCVDWHSSTKHRPCTVAAAPDIAVASPGCNQGSVGITCGAHSNTQRVRRGR